MTEQGVNRSQEQRFEKSAVQEGTRKRRGCLLYELKKVFGIFSKNRHKFPIGINMHQLFFRDHTGNVE